MDRIQCSSCKRQKFVSDFLKNGKTLKTCITCRAPKRSATVDSVVKTTVKAEIPKVTPTAVPIVVPKAPDPIVTLIEEPIKVPGIPKKRWRYLSGKWIHEGEERQLHERMMKKMNRDFQERAAFAVHKYLTRWIMVDIRDL